MTTAAADILPHYDLARQGRVFTGNIAAAGVVLPIYSSTTQQVGLWNPVDSNIDVILLRICLTYVDTTGAAGGYVLAQLTDPNPEVSAGSPISAFTETAAVSHYPDGDQASAARFAQGATITVTAPTIKRHLALNQNAFTADGTGQMPFANEIVFHGEEVLTPGIAVFVAGNIETLARWSGSLTWAEVPR